MGENSICRRVAILDREGAVRVVELGGGAAEEHTHSWADITDAPPLEGPGSIVKVGENGKLPAETVPGMEEGEEPLTYGAESGEAGKFDRKSEAPTAVNSPLRYNGEFRATKVFGVYFSDNADLAEFYRVEGKAEPGDLIAITPSGELRVNDRPFSKKILGIVSTRPGMILGWARRRKKEVPIALAGRVPVKAEGTIKPGDHLVAGTRPGTVRALEIAGSARGSIVGMALEGKNDPGVGKVLALVLRM